MAASRYSRLCSSAVRCSAEAPALPARVRLQIAGDDLFVGRRADTTSAQANAAVLEDGLVSGQHARITRVAGGYDLEDLGSKNGTWVDNTRVEGKVQLRDGALVFIGNVGHMLGRLAGKFAEAHENIGERLVGVVQPAVGEQERRDHQWGPLERPDHARARDAVAERRGVRP